MTAALVDMDAVMLHADNSSRARKALWQAKPFVRLWANPGDGLHDSGLILRGVASDSMGGKVSFSRQDNTTATLKLRMDHHLARWIISIPNDPEAKKNVIMTVDHMGGSLRWSGMYSDWHAKKDSRGVYYLEVSFIDDRQYFKALLGATNPALPIPLFQFPRVLPGFGPTKWLVSVFLLIQMIRVQSNVWSLPDDPFSWESWEESLNWTEWQAHIVAPSLLEDSSLWGLLATRMDDMDSVVKDLLDAAQLTVEYRRVLTVDGEHGQDYGLPYDVRNGALVFEIKDNSGYYDSQGTGFNWGIGSGFVRSVIEFGDGFVEEYVGSAIEDENDIWPDEYYQHNWWLPVPTRPWIVLHDSKWSQVETSDIGYTPAGPVAVAVGGDNPYVDQMVELTIQAVGNILGYISLGGFSSAGDIAATVVMPFLKGTILAWLYWKNTRRADSLGWAHLWETKAGGGDQNAWSLSSIAALNEAFAATKAKSVHQLTFNGAGPIYPGIHLRPGYRVASTADRILPGFVHVDAVENIDLEWDYTGDDRCHKYSIQIGSGEVASSFAERFAKLYSSSLTTLEQLGVRLIS
jgi:hypothetical protein